jgi:hypothetical protein
MDQRIVYYHALTSLAFFLASNTDEEGARSLKKNVQKRLIEKYLSANKKTGNDPS